MESDPFPFTEYYVESMFTVIDFGHADRSDFCSPKSITPQNRALWN